MRKGLAVILGTLAFALAGTASFAKAPVFSNVPDIVIGDNEDNVGQTVDQNFFRYVNAINILNFVRDDDSTSPDLKFVFTEPTTHEDISINAKKQLNIAGGGDPNDPSTWGTAEFTNQAGHPARSFLLSFRDLVRSPDTGTPPFPSPGANGLLPWHQAGGGLGGAANGRVVNLWVTDMDNIDSESLVVFSLNGGADDLSGAFTTLFAQGSLPTQWTYSNGSPTLPAATSGTGAGLVTLTAGLTATGSITTAAYDDKYFGRWGLQDDATSAPGFRTGRIVDQPGTLIYAARFTLSHNVALLQNVPSIRIGVRNDNNSQQLQNSIESVANADPNANPHLAASGVSRVYPLYWSANTQAPNVANLHSVAGVGDQDNWSAFFDVLDADNAKSGTWTLSAFDVLTMNRPNDQTADATITDFTTGFVASTGTTGAQPTFATSAVGGTFTDPGTSVTDAAQGNYMLRERANTIAWTAGKLIRIKANVSCPTTANRNNFHRFRVRHRVFFGNVAQEFFINNNSGFSSIGYPYMPIARDGNDALSTRYEIYLPAYGGSTALLTTNGGGSFALGLDQLHHVGDAGVRANATATTVHQVTYEVINEPVLP